MRKKDRDAQRELSQDREEQPPLFQVRPPTPRPEAFAPANAELEANPPLAAIDLRSCHFCSRITDKAAFIHWRIAHQIGCYVCAKKLMKDKKPCPICRRKIEKVCRVIEG